MLMLLAAPFFLVVTHTWFYILCFIVALHLMINESFFFCFTSRQNISSPFFSPL